MIGIYILFFSVILWSVNCVFNLANFISKGNLDSKNIAKILYVKYFLVILVFLASVFIPILEGFGAARLCYSFFGDVSVFCVLILIFFCKDILSLDSKSIKYNKFLRDKIIESSKNSSAKKCGIFLAISLAGLILYGHSFSFFRFDLFHSNVMIQACVAILLIGFIFLMDRIYGLLGLLALGFSLFIHIDFSILEFLICPYLWVFSVIYVAVFLLKLLLLKFKKSYQLKH